MSSSFEHNSSFGVCLILVLILEFQDFIKYNSVFIFFLKYKLLLEVPYKNTKKVVFITVNEAS